MAKLQASWIHGSSVQPQREGYFISKERRGAYAVFCTHGAEWFHFAIPTPVIVDGQRASLTKIFILYETKGTAKITKVHVWDGCKQIKLFENLSLSGSHAEVIDQMNSWVINPAYKMAYGLGISVHVEFGAPVPNMVPEIHFVTAGADFETP